MVTSRGQGGKGRPQSQSEGTERTVSARGFLKGHPVQRPLPSLWTHSRGVEGEAAFRKGKSVSSQRPAGSSETLSHRFPVLIAKGNDSGVEVPPSLLWGNGFLVIA